MDLLAAVLDRLPFIMSDLVVYGSMALTSAAIYLLAFFGIVGSFYRSSSSLGPPTRALAAAWALLVPTAAVFSGLAVAAARHNLGDFSTARVLAALLGPPLLLWPAAVALTSTKAVREAHMPPEPAPAAAEVEEEKQALVAEPAGSGSTGGVSAAEGTTVTESAEVKKEQ